MSKKKKTRTKSSVTGRFVSPNYVDGHEEETFVQTITISKAKYKEACQMLEQLKEPKHHGNTAAGRNYQELLEWLLEKGSKPQIN